MDLRKLAQIPPWDWPDDMALELLGVLRDSDVSPERRLLAVEMAGDMTVVNDELAEVLLAIVQNRDEQELLRGKAAIALGPALEEADTMGFNDPDDSPISQDLFGKLQQTLREVYQDTGQPKDVRRMVLEAAVRAPQEWHREAIRSAYGSHDEEWKLTAVFCMVYVAGFEKEICEALDSDDPDIHYQAVRAAGNWEVKAAWKHVAALATSNRTDKPLQLAAIEAAAAIHPQKARDLFVDLLDSDDEELREVAAEALVMAGQGGEFHDDYDDE